MCSAPYPPHRTPVGEIVIRLHGQEVRAELLSTGKHCRSYGVRIGGEVVGIMGLYEAWRLHVSPAVARLLSRRA